MTFNKAMVVALAGTGIVVLLGRQRAQHAGGACVGCTAEARITISLLPVPEGMTVEPPTPGACLIVSLLPDQSADPH